LQALFACQQAASLLTAAKVTKTLEENGMGRSTHLHLLQQLFQRTLTKMHKSQLIKMHRSGHVWQQESDAGSLHGYQAS